MSETPEMPEVEPQPQHVPPTAVSVYGQGNGLDDFPVLKAFQQYIDSEQSKARKRLVTISIFFGLLMSGVIAVFVMLLINVSQQNQRLNDRLVDVYAMRDREHAAAPQAAAPVVVQPAQDSAAILALTSKLEELQKKMADEQAKTLQLASEKAEQEKAAAVKAAIEAERAAVEAAKPKGPSPAELEVKRLKALLDTKREQEKLALERQREAEIEAYRRKHYPELYEEKPQPKKPTTTRKAKPALLDDDDAISYYDDEEDEDEEEEEEVVVRKPVKKQAPKKAPAVEKKTETDYTIPVEVRGTKSSWKIPD